MTSRRSDRYPSLGLAAVRPDAQPAPISPELQPAASSGLASVVRTPEVRALDAHVQNSIGTSIAISHVLKKLVDQAPSILAKLTGSGEDGMSPKEFLLAVRDISRANAVSSKAIAEIVAASRATAGTPQRHEHLHAHAHAVASPAPVLSTEDKEARMRRLVESYARLSSPVEFEGMEDGIAEEEEDGETDHIAEPLGG